MLTKIFIKPLKRSAHNRKARRTKQHEYIAGDKQGNLVAKLKSEVKRQCFKNFKNSKPFWDKCTPYFSNKHVHDDSKIILIGYAKFSEKLKPS